jgi:hypothetical protein
VIKQISWDDVFHRNFSPTKGELSKVFQREKLTLVVQRALIFLMSNISSLSHMLGSA